MHFLLFLIQCIHLAHAGRNCNDTYCNKLAKVWPLEKTKMTSLSSLSTSSRVIGFSNFCGKRKKGRGAEQYSICGKTRGLGASKVFWLFLNICLGVNENLEQGRHFNFFLWGQFFYIFQCHRTIEKLEKKHSICSNLTLFIVPFYLFSVFFSFVFFCLFFFFFFFFLLGRRPPISPQMTPPTWRVERQVA